MPKLFVIMPFGIRPAPQAPESKLDFDEVYNRLIRPAAEKAGWSALRIDELPEAGHITDQYLREILAADLVLADISLPNANVFYELGIRQAISTGGTILLACEGSSVPFDIASQRIIFYRPSYPDLHAAKQQIIEFLLHHSAVPPQNPIRSFLETIGAVASPQRDSAAFEREITGRIERSRTVDQLIAVWHWAKNFRPLPIIPLLALAEKLSDFEEWLIAAEILRAALKDQPKDFEIHRQLGWYLQHLGPEYDVESLHAFEQALALNPLDPETLGMMGGRLKRQGNYIEAANYYDRGAKVSPNSLYILVNQAAVKILADPKNPQPGVELYRALADRIQRTRATSPDEWSELVLGESLFAIGDFANARRHLANAIKMASSPKSLDSAAKQLELLAEVGFRREEAQALVNLLKKAQTPILASEVATHTDQQRDIGGLGHPIQGLPILVHLSDVHFGSSTKNGVEVDKHRFYEGENSQPLSRHIIGELTAKGSRFFGAQNRIQLIISGDLTYTGAKQEFEKAKLFLNEVCNNVGISKDKVHIIPGNHDVSWALAKHDKTYRFDNYINFLVDFYGDGLFRLKYPRIKWPLMMNDPRPNAYEIVSLYHDIPNCLLIIGFNSCVYENEQHHYGFIGERQLRIVRELLDDAQMPHNFTRIALIHHHPSSSSSFS
jgi:tetratricopeptide (TPR) repeat protein